MTEQNRNKMGRPVDEGIIQRVVTGVKYVVGNIKPDTWFGPQQPLEPSAQQVKGRELDYPVGFNLKIPPRSEEPVTFEMMRALADGYDLLRLVIETRKDQLAKFKWNFMKVGSDETDDSDTNIKYLKEFFRYPDKQNDFATWMRKIVEDMLVIDATTVYPRPNRGGGIYALEVLDGSKIKRVIDADGRTPEPPDVAYSQVLHGLPAVDFHRDELIYKPRNVRSHKLFGYSPVEQIIMSVNIALRRQMFQLNFYTEGNIPEALCAVPETWSPQQIEYYQKMWDAIMEGDLAKRRKMKFVPGGMKPEQMHPDGLKDEFDEWLARIVCYAFSVPPTPFVKMMNRATAQSVQQAALQEGLIPLQNWMKSLLDDIIQRFLGLPEYEAIWVDKDETDPLVEAQVWDKMLTRGAATINEWRDSRGMDDMGLDGDVHLIYTASGAVRLEDVIKEPEPQQTLALQQEGVVVEGKPQEGQQQGQSSNSKGVKQITGSPEGQKPKQITDGKTVEKSKKKILY